MSKSKKINKRIKKKGGSNPIMPQEPPNDIETMDWNNILLMGDKEDVEECSKITKEFLFHCLRVRQDRRRLYKKTDSKK